MDFKDLRIEQIRPRFLEAMEKLGWGKVRTALASPEFLEEIISSYTGDFIPSEVFIARPPTHIEYFGVTLIPNDDIQSAFKFVEENGH